MKTPDSERADAPQNAVTPGETARGETVSGAAPDAEFFISGESALEESAKEVQAGLAPTSNLSPATAAERLEEGASPANSARPNRIVRAAPRDLAALLALETACFAEAWSDHSLAKLLENPAYLSLLSRDDEGKPRGYLIGWQVGGDVELARVGVCLEARGQGIGADLVRAALRIWQTAGAQSVWLEVRESNVAARRLYALLKFLQVGKRPNYYADGETALVLQLDLDA